MSTCRLTRVLARSLPLALILLAPAVAGACFWVPSVASSRVDGTLPGCLAAEHTREAAPGQDFEGAELRTNLLLRSTCFGPVELQIPDCMDCEGPMTIEPDTRMVVDVGVYIDETVGEDVEVPVSWSRPYDEGEATVVFEMADTHPDDQNNPCERFRCSVGGEAGMPTFAVVLFLAGAWSRRRRPNGSRAAATRS